MCRRNRRKWGSPVDILETTSRACVTSLLRILHPPRGGSVAVYL